MRAINYLFGGKSTIKVDSLRNKSHGMQAKISGKRRKKMANKCLMGRMFNWLSFDEAFVAVRRNKGAAGVDGKSILETVEHWQQHGAQIEETLLAGTYVPSPVLGVKKKSLKTMAASGCWEFLRCKTE